MHYSTETPRVPLESYTTTFYSKVARTHASALFQSRIGSRFTPITSAGASYNYITNRN